MRTFKVTNTSDADIDIDTVGENNPKDRTILHPSNSVTVDLSNDRLKALKLKKGLSFIIVKQG